MDLAMPMGCASSSQTFQAFSDALVWIAQKKFGVGPIICVLDDFLFIKASEDRCKLSLSRFEDMCDERKSNWPEGPENYGEGPPESYFYRKSSGSKGQRKIKEKQYGWE